MRVGAVVLGVLMVLAGLVWIGQGLGVVKGSFMTGDMHWFWIGSAVALAGLLLGAGSLLYRRRA